MLTAAYQQLRSLFLPSICAHCRQYLATRDVLCVTCTNLLVPIVPKVLTVNSAYTLAVHAVSAYDAPLRTLIVAKNHGDYLAGYQLGRIMSDRLLQESTFDYFVPVPLHWTRSWWRGFNQSETIAQVMAAKHKAPVLNVVRRMRRTQFQAELTAPARANNIKQAFALIGSGGRLRDKHIVLVDDLMTTGSTLIEVAKIIAQAEPASLCAVVACRVV